jgi:acyl dehydratase
MTLNYHAFKSAPVAECEQRYEARDAILYALGVGCGADPVDAGDLRHVYEDGLVVLPTFATVLGFPFMWFADPRFGVDAARIVHAGHALRMHAPLPAAGSVHGRTVARAVCDKGAGRGAILVFERELTDLASGRLLATQTMTLMARGDGGFSQVPGNGPAGGDPLQRERLAVPQTPPDAVVMLPTLPQAALIYRLVADPNPLHADPRFAREAGFDRPILHGLCAYGMAGRAVVQAFAAGDATRLVRLVLHFAAPVFPGDTLRFELWREGAAVRLRASVPQRDAIVVLDAGEATLA